MTKKGCEMFVPGDCCQTTTARVWAGDAASTRPAATRYYSGVCAGHPDDGFPAHDRRREEPEGGVL